MSDTELVVSWQPPASTGGDDVVKYAVQWDVDSNFDTSMSTTIVQAVGSQTDYTAVLNGLSAGTQYAVRVLAYNIAGYSNSAFAVPVDFYEEVQTFGFKKAAALTNGQTSDSFTLSLTAHGATRTTGSLNCAASAKDVEDALNGLDNIGAVKVSRYDSSSDPDSTDANKLIDGSGVDTSAFRLTYKVTFVGIKDSGDVGLLSMVKIGTDTAHLFTPEVGTARAGTDPAGVSFISTPCCSRAWVC
jgi:hypothetical protein